MVCLFYNSSFYKHFYHYNDCGYCCNGELYAEAVRNMRFISIPEFVNCSQKVYNRKISRKDLNTEDAYAYQP